MTTDVVKRFEEDRPIAVLGHMALDRLLDKEAMDALFHEVAEEQYERKILFSAMVKLMAAVVLCKHPSVNAAYRKMSNEIGASLTALYTKLTYVERFTSQALVRYSYERVKEVSNWLRSYDARYVIGYRTRIVDGNQLSGTEHRLEETRNSTAAPLPGKALVVYDPHREAICDLFPIEDGHAQERNSLDDVLETIEKNDLWIGDRSFCTLKFLYGIDGKPAKFIIRHHGQIKGQAIGPRRYIGTSETGKVYEQEFELPTYEGKVLRVRRIEVDLDAPTRDGDLTIAILTNLSEDEATAIEVADIYRNRWTLETAFQRMTESLQCEINTLCFPKAALFAFAIACVAYNAVAVVLAGISSVHGKAQTETLSFYYLSLEMAQTHDGMTIAIPESHWETIRQAPIQRFADELCRIAANIDISVYRKTPRGPKKKKPKPKHQKNKVHISTAKVLAQRRT